MRTQHDLAPGEAVTVDGLSPRVAVVADDLIWASRLRAAVERAGAIPSVPRQGHLPAGSDLADPAPLGAIVDLGLRRADAVLMIRDLVASGIAVIAVGQHEDLALRKRALAAGATRVYSYNKAFTAGPSLIARWLRGLGKAPS